MQSGVAADSARTDSELGSHAIRVEVNVPGAKVRTRPGYRVQ